MHNLIYDYSDEQIQYVLVHIFIQAEKNTIGTGFFISNNLILTARHVIDTAYKNNLEIIINSKYINDNINSKNIFFSESENSDIAFIKLDNPVNIKEIPMLFGIDIKEKEDFKSWGFFNIDYKQGHVPIAGEFHSKNIFNNNVKLDFINKSFSPSIQGASGSPLVIGNKIIGFLIQEITNGSASINTRAKLFIDPEIQKLFQEKPELKGLLQKQFIPEKERKYLSMLSKFSSLTGFFENEYLEYQETYATWESFGFDSDNSPEVVTKLIEEYFVKHGANRKDNILFIVADYGMGKSSFMKNYSASLAVAYIQANQDYFPVYFNLKEFMETKRKYTSKPEKSIISLAFKEKYGIDLSDNYYIEKKIIFIIDSLDESGELNQSTLEYVISDIIQTVPNAEFIPGHYRFILASRPIPNIINQLITKYSQKKINHKEKLYPQYISLYGFYDFKDQFNKYIKFALQKNILKAAPNQNIQDFLSGEIDIYDHLNGYFKKDELRRPIYAYLIYRLLLEGVDVLTLSEFGLYCEFINQLTIRADFMDKTKPTDEYLNRYVLHVIAALRQIKLFEGHRVVNLDADFNQLYDNQKYGMVLEKAKNIIFSSLAYLKSETKNQLAFHHDSIAEFLLAEYYIKIFLCYALEGQCEVLTIRRMLLLGNPSPETIHFLKEIIQQIITSVQGDNQDKLRSRKNLFSLLCSIGMKTKTGINDDQSPIYKQITKIYSGNLNKDWIEDIVGYDDLNKGRIEYICENEKWPIDDIVLNRIIAISKQIINSEDSLMLQRDADLTGKVLRIQNRLYNQSIDIDKWISLSIGKTISEELKHVFYDVKTSLAAASMIQCWSKFNDYCSPAWARNLFSNIQLIGTFENPIRFNNINFEGNYDKEQTTSFSNANLSFVDFGNCNLNYVSFENCKFDAVSFFRANIFGTIFENISIQIEKESIQKSMGIILFDAICVKSVKLPDKISEKYFFIDRESNFFDKYRKVFPEIENIFDSAFKYTGVRLSNPHEVLDNRRTIKHLFEFLIKNRNIKYDQLRYAYFFYEELKGFNQLHKKMMYRKEDPFKAELKELFSLPKSDNTDEFIDFNDIENPNHERPNLKLKNRSDLR